MFAATKRLLVTLAFTATVCGFGISQDDTSNRRSRAAAGQQPTGRSHLVHRSAGSNHQQENSRPMGLLDRLRSLSGGAPRQTDEPAESFSEPPPADWTDIPYHDPKSSRNTARSKPMTDPAANATQSPSSARVAVSPRHTSAPSSPSTVQVPLGVGRIPTPPADVANPTQALAPPAAMPSSDVSRPGFSATYSSRRSNRRPVEAMSSDAASPSDRSSEELAEKKDALAVSTQNPVIDVDSDDQHAPLVRQRPVPQRSLPASTQTNADDQPSSASTPPSLAVRGSDSESTAGRPSPVPAKNVFSTNAASTEDSSAWRTSQPATEAGDSGTEIASTTTDANKSKSTEMGEVDQLQPVGSGLGAGARSGNAVSADSAVSGSFEKRSVEANGGDGSALAASSGFQSEVPAIRVVAAGPSEIMIRQQTPYEIHVENRGSMDAPGVLVRAQLPNWAKVRKETASAGKVSQNPQGNTQELIWQIEDLPAGAKQKLVLQLQAEQSGTFEVNVDWTLLPRKEVMQVNVREPMLKLVIEGPDQVTYGESETYRVRVLNPGNGVAPNVVFTLSPNSATPQSQVIGNIPAGKEAEFEVELTAQDLGTLEIHGLATGELTLRTEETKKIKVASAKLEATLSGPPLKYQDGEAIYELQVRNVGSASSRNVVASLQLPSGLKYIDGLKDAAVKEELLTWTIDQIDAGELRDYQFRCQMATTGTHRLAFQCEGSAAGKTAVAIETKVEALADLVLSVNDPPAPAPVGEEVSYEIVIRNRGSKAAISVQAITHFSENIEPLRVEGHAGKVSTGQVEFEAIDRIEPGQEITLRIIAKAAQEGLHRFRSEVSSADTVLVAEEATRYLGAATEQISRRSGDSQTR